MSDSEQKVSVRAGLSIELVALCPLCDEIIDLMSHVDKERGYLDEEGRISKQTVGGSNWSVSHEKFSEDVICPECNTEFCVHGIDY